MDVELYTPKQLAEVEQRLSTSEMQAVGGRLWKWRFESAPSPLDAPCFVLGERSGGPRAWASAVRIELVLSGNVVSAAQVAGGDLSRVSGDETFDRELFDR